MKRFVLPLVLIGVAVISGSLLAAEPLPDAVAQVLQDVREQEKLSHDAYLYFAALYPEQHPGANIFVRVTEAEQRHMDAVLKLLDKYGVADPVAVDGVVSPPGEFPDTAVQDLYDAYTTNGAAGFAEALDAAIAIESADIARLEGGIAASASYPDIVQVYSNLLAASQSHLAAFLRVLGMVDADAELVLTDVQACTAGNGRW